MTLRLESVSSGYGNAIVVRDVSLSVADGETITVLGSNGAGKSTLLKTCAGVLRPLSGTVSIAGRRLNGDGPLEHARQGIAWVPEGRRLFPSLSIHENLLVAARGVDSAVVDERVEATLELFPMLRKMLRRPAWAASGGEQQMVAVGRALMMHPRFLLLDEPSLGLAPMIVRTLMEALAEIGRDGPGMIVVEQNVDAGLELADRAVVIAHGRVVFDGSPQELRNTADVFASYLD